MIQLWSTTFLNQYIAAVCISEVRVGDLQNDNETNIINSEINISTIFN